MCARALLVQVNLVATQLVLDREHPNRIVFSPNRGLDPLLDLRLRGAQVIFCHSLAVCSTKSMNLFPHETSKNGGKSYKMWTSWKSRGQSQV